jgi:hypothetical protein
MRSCKTCILKDCSKRNESDERMVLCFGHKMKPEDEICCYFSPECSGQSKHNCGYHDEVCICPQESMSK